MVDRIEVLQLLERQVLMRASRKTRQGMGGREQGAVGVCCEEQKSKEWN